MYRQKLLALGIPADIRGFMYLNAAIESYEPFISIIKLYENIAEKYGTTSSRVEKAIRHAVKKVEESTNGQFIAKYHFLWEDERHE